MMSARSCRTCNKTVYVNEKMEANGRWYHKFCFKCSAPSCTTTLNIRTFQMAVLDENVKDKETGRPLKVLVCKQHVPLPKSSLSTDSLEIRHTTSAPKAPVLGLHRALMGGRGKAEGNNDTQSSTASPRPFKASTGASMSGSAVPRSAEGTGLDSFHHQFNSLGLDGNEDGNVEKDKNKEIPLVDKEDAKDGGEEEDTKDGGEEEDAKGGGEEEDNKTDTPTLAKTTTTLPRFEGGKFSISEEARVENPEQQEEEDDSFRTLPVSHDDYEAQSRAANPHHPPQHYHRESSPELEDAKQERIFRMKSTTVDDIVDDKEEDDSSEKDDKSSANPQVNLTLNKRFMMPQSPSQGSVQSDNEDPNDDDDWGAPEDHIPMSGSDIKGSVKRDQMAAM